MPMPQKVIEIYKHSLHQLDPKNEIHIIDRYDVSNDNAKKEIRKGRQFDKILGEKIKKIQ